MRRTAHITAKALLAVAMLVAVSPASVDATPNKGDVPPSIAQQFRRPQQPAPSGEVHRSSAGRYVVGFERGDRATVVRAVRDAGATVVRSGDDKLVVKAGGAGGAAALQEEVLSLGGVEYVEPDVRITGALIPTDSMYAQQWGMPNINAPAAWDYTTGSAEVTLAVVDSGVDYYHPDLAGHVDTANDYDFYNYDDDAWDDHGHGTHVAGIAAGTMNNGGGFITGVAPLTTILPVKVLGSGNTGWGSDFADGIEYAAEMGADVISMSITMNDSTAYPYYTYLQDAVDYAAAHDAVVVAAAGNEGSYALHQVGFPAAYPGVIAVGATDNDPVDSKASFSSYGVPLDSDGYEIPWAHGVSIAAPGVSILSSLPGTTTGSWSGTSMATPFVSGTIALMRARYPSAPGIVLANQVLFSARKVDQDNDGYVEEIPGYEADTVEMGFGILDASLAVSRTPEPDDYPDTASSLSVGVVEPGAIEPGDGLDFWSVPVAAGAVRGFTLTPEEGNDFDLHVFMDDGTWLGSSQASGSMPDVVTAKAPHAGAMYAVVMKWTGSGAYTISRKDGATYLSKPTPMRASSPYSPVSGVLTKYRTYRWVGGLKPYHAVGGHAVYISISRYNASTGQFVYLRKYTATNYKRLSMTEYRVNFPLGPGRYRLTPVAPEDSTHARTVGTANYVTVR